MHCLCTSTHVRIYLRSLAASLRAILNIPLGRLDLAWKCEPVDLFSNSLDWFNFRVLAGTSIAGDTVKTSAGFEGTVLLKVAVRWR